MVRAQVHEGMRTPLTHSELDDHPDKKGTGTLRGMMCPLIRQRTGCCIDETDLYFFDSLDGTDRVCLRAGVRSESVGIADGGHLLAR